MTTPLGTDQATVTVRHGHGVKSDVICGAISNGISGVVSPGNIGAVKLPLISQVIAARLDTEGGGTIVVSVDRTGLLIDDRIGNRVKAQVINIKKPTAGANLCETQAHGGLVVRQRQAEKLDPFLLHRVVHSGRGG